MRKKSESEKKKTRCIDLHFLFFFVLSRIVSPLSVFLAAFFRAASSGGTPAAEPWPIPGRTRRLRAAATPTRTTTKTRRRRSSTRRPPRSRSTRRRRRSCPPAEEATASNLSTTSSSSTRSSSRCTRSSRCTSSSSITSSSSSSSTMLRSSTTLLNIIISRWAATTAPVSLSPLSFLAFSLSLSLSACEESLFGGKRHPVRERERQTETDRRRKRREQQRKKQSTIFLFFR